MIAGLIEQTRLGRMSSAMTGSEIFADGGMAQV
jgi:hypothetical protein